MLQNQIDVAANRAAIKYTGGERVRRVLWALIGRPVFRLVPRPFFAVRNSILRVYGARIGHHVHIYASASIYMPWNLRIGDWSSIGEWASVYNVGLVTIGSGATISQKADLCAGTHDYHRLSFPLLKQPIVIGDGAWICAGAFIGPGVTISDLAIVGARAVVMKNVPPRAIVVGNPATLLRLRPEMDGRD